MAKSGSGPPAQPDRGTSTAVVGMPGTRAATVAAELRAMILSGELRSGTRLRQAKISKQFGVSTTPVREAFATLAREGLLSQDPHKGVRVLLPSQADLHENYDIRLALEPLATELAARRLSEQQLDELGELLDRMRDSERNPAESEAILSEANTIFHRTIYAAADRPRLAEIIEQLRNSSAIYIHIASALPPPAYGKQAATEHERVLAALRVADGERAAEEMRVHLRHGLERISKVLDGLMKEDGGSALRIAEG